MKKIKIVSWNIAGCRPIKSSELFDYEKENLAYFYQELEKVFPDIVCLQETHTNEGRSLAKELAEMFEMKYVFNTPKNSSHIDSDYQVGDAILSRFSLEDKNVYEYPNQWKEFYFKDGTKGVVHYKTLQVVKTESFFVGNTQMLPIKLFGYNYEEGEGAILADKIQEVLLQKLIRPVIFCGDFNFDNPVQIYPKVFETLELLDALPNKTTRPNSSNEKKTPDHIFYSPEFKLINSGIVETNTDHYLCWAEFEYEK